MPEQAQKVLARASALASAARAKALIKESRERNQRKQKANEQS
ncbi:hypothetical protein [Alteromonas facilis]|nr:hypothetical protein [Alteromonas facilis]